jgi:hypothetical protein
MLPPGVNKIDMRRGGAVGSIREGHQENERGDDDDDFDRYMEGFEEAADEPAG